MDASPCRPAPHPPHPSDPPAASLPHPPPHTLMPSEAKESLSRKRGRALSISWGTVHEYQFTPTLDASKVSITEGPPIGLGDLQSSVHHKSVEAYHLKRFSGPSDERRVNIIPPEERLAAVRQVRRIESIEHELNVQEATRRGRRETVRELFAEEIAARRAQREQAAHKHVEATFASSSVAGTGTSPSVKTESIRAIDSQEKAGVVREHILRRVPARSTASAASKLVNKQNWPDARHVPDVASEPAAGPASPYSVVVR